MSVCGFSGRDVVYVVNFGTAADNEIYGMLDYVRGAYCRYSDSSSRVGLVLYGRFVNVSIPLAAYSYAEWQQRVYDVEHSNYSQLHGGQSPLTEALALAGVEFSAVSPPLVLPLVEIVTSALPQPVPVALQNESIPSRWAYPYASTYEGAYVCAGTSPGTCSAPVSYAQYLGASLPASVAELQSLNAFISVLLVPESSAGSACVSSMIYDGVAGFIDPSCTRDFFEPSGTFNWCALYSSDLGAPVDALICRCAK